MHSLEIIAAAVARNVIPVTCFAGAAAVACTGNDGWGWLIFAGIITS